MTELATEYQAALVLVDEQTKADALMCPRCGGERQTDRLIFCFACCVTFDDESIRVFLEIRDTMAAWMVEAKPLLAVLQATNDPGYPAAQAFWDMRAKNFKALCFILGAP